MPTPPAPAVHANPARWRAFTDRELATIGSALVMSADFLAADVANGEIHAADLSMATAEQLTAITLADQVDDVRRAA